MSSWPTDEDLIDFEVGSPDLPQGSLTALLDSESLPRSLLDSELLHLEETLQTASSSPQKPLSRCVSQDSVELEQILITIDDDLVKKKDNNSISRNEDILDVVERQGEKCHALKNNVERRLSITENDLHDGNSKEDTSLYLLPTNFDVNSRTDGQTETNTNRTEDDSQNQTRICSEFENINKNEECDRHSNIIKEDNFSLNSKIDANIHSIEIDKQEENSFYVLDRTVPDKEENTFDLSRTEEYSNLNRNRDIDLQYIELQENNFINCINSEEKKYLPSSNGTEEDLDLTRQTNIDLQNVDTTFTLQEHNYLPIVDTKVDHISLLDTKENADLHLSSNEESLDISSALEELDKVLKQSTNSNKNFENVDETNGLVTDENEENIEDCLKDLDEYLQGFDTSGSDLEEEKNKYLGRSKSLKYRKEGKENLGFDAEERRPASADLNRGNPYRNTIESRHSQKRPYSADVNSQRGKKILTTDLTQHQLNVDDFLTKNEIFLQNNENLLKENFKRTSFRQSLDLRKNKVRPYSADCHTFKRNKLRNTISKISTSKSSQNVSQINSNYFTNEDVLSKDKYDIKIEQDCMYDNTDINNVSNQNDAEELENHLSCFKTDKLQNINMENSAQNMNTNTQEHNVEPINMFSQNLLVDQNTVSTSQTGIENDIQMNRHHRSLPRILDHRQRSEQNAIVEDVQISLQQRQENRSHSFPRNYRGLPSQDTNITEYVNKFNRSVSSESDEEIDWSWVQDMSSPTPISLPPSPPSPKSLAPHWLRSSMRRLRHLPLPTSQPIVTSTPSLAEPVVLNPEPPRARPVSAPVRVERTDRSLDRESTRSGGSETTESTTSEESERAEERREERRPCEPPQQTMPDTRSPMGQWPHGLSSMFACLGCTIGLFNLSRFAVLSVQFGANFIIQFLILSLVFGIPLFTLQLCLGQQLSAGVVDMWRISPLFQGVGIALLAAQALIGLYSIVGVSWMFIYFRDSFITKQDQYKWAEPFEPYRTESRAGFNDTYRISETVPDYFNGIVLQRHNVIDSQFSGGIKFQVAFNLAVVWMIVFVSLSKGLRSYAKVVYVFSLLPIFGTFVLCAKLLGMSPNDTFHEIFPATAWGEFFLNTKSWIAASQEAFLTWGLLGAAIMQLSSHNKHKHLLQRDSSLVIILTITILMLIAFLANTCIEIIHANGYTYIPNSFERISTYAFLRSNKDPLPPSLSSTPVRYMTHSSFIIGERVIRPGMDKSIESGYQVLRFATELVPATLALLGPTHISPFWAVLFYFILILFGIAQQLAIWHCVITGIMAIKAKALKQWETTITFFTCTFGFILGLPMATEFGIFVVYFLDYCVGGAWWLLFIYLLQIVAVFMIRGRPYSGDTVVTALFTPNSGSCMQAWLAPLLSFVWNVILPVALMVVCITQFKAGNFKELYIWHHALSVEYWPTWARQVGSLIQLMPILCIPIVAIIQSYRYLNNGPADILDRIQLLYRPPLDSEHLSDLSIQQAASAATTPATNPPAEDPPPKYTPPPSYTTATGARIAKMLRQSIRRSVRRIQSVLGEGSRTTDRPQLQVPPPDYSAVLVEMNQSLPSVSIDVTESSVPNQSDRISRELSSLQSSPLTAADVASILRSSFRRSTVRTHRIRNEDVPSGSLSAECLVDTVAPIGEDSLVLETIRSEKDNRSSVI